MSERSRGRSSEPRCVSDIAATVHLSQSLASHHLSLLRAGHILRADRQGKQVFCAPADEHVQRVLADTVAHVEEPIAENYRKGVDRKKSA